MNLPREFVIRVLQIALLSLPIAWTFIRYLSLTGSEEQRISLWLRHRRANHVLGIVVLVLWCGLSSATALPAYVFWVAPLTTSILVQTISRIIDRSILERRWTTSDILRLAWWGTVHPFATLLMIATGFNGTTDGRWSACGWFIAAAITALVGSVCLRSAQGLNKRRVKSGTLYVRALHLAKKMGVKLRWIYVVPSGRGNLTNAFASWRSIALTDNFGEYLHGPQLDCVIAHELAHAKNKHVQKELLILVALFSSLILLSFAFAPLMRQYRPLLVSLLLFVSLLAYYAMSRRFEYEADRDSVRLIANPEAEIRSLAALYRKTGTPIEHSNLLELFMTHPGFTNRISAIAKFGDVPEARVSEILREAGVTDDVPLPTR